jgi:hypothetical protein
MDQVRTVLGWLKRQHFWVLCVVVAALALASWFRAANALEEEAKRNESTIKQEFNAQSQLRSQQFHANESINSQQVEEIKKQSEIVSGSWEQLYNRQREGVLKWPSELDQKFRDYVAKLKFGDPIPGELRNHYMNYVGTHFKKLPELIGARVMEEGAGGGASRFGRPSRLRVEGLSRSGAGTEQVEQEDYIVEWLDQQNVRDELDMPREPSDIRIWVTQEDLWVYHTLLQVIANTNEAAGADRYSNAAVRVIESLEVGRPAAMASRGAGRIMMLAPAAETGGEGISTRDMMSGPGDHGITPEFLHGRGEGLPGSESAEDEKAALLTDRYLDAEGNPTSESGVEYKRLPVRMSLVMDQRWLTHLIAECASAPLQIEVQEVRINPSDFESSGRGSGRRSGGMREMGGFRPQGGGSEVTEFPQEPNVVPVIIQGVIYIFNEPDPTLLQVSEDQV